MRITEWRRARYARTDELLREWRLPAPLHRENPKSDRWVAFEQLAGVLDRELPLEGVACDCSEIPPDKYQNLPNLPITVTNAQSWYNWHGYSCPAVKAESKVAR